MSPSLGPSLAWKSGLPVGWGETWCPGLAGCPAAAGMASGAVVLLASRIAFPCFLELQPVRKSETLGGTLPLCCAFTQRSIRADSQFQHCSWLESALVSGSLQRESTGPRSCGCLRAGLPCDSLLSWAWEWNPPAPALHPVESTAQAGAQDCGRQITGDVPFVLAVYRLEEPLFSHISPAPPAFTGGRWEHCGGRQAGETGRGGARQHLPHPQGASSDPQEGQHPPTLLFFQFVFIVVKYT